MSENKNGVAAEAGEAASTSNEYKDKEGRTWRISLTVGILADVREHYQIEIGKMLSSEKGLVELVFADPERFCNVLYLIVKDQVDKAGISDRQFGNSFDGPTWDRAILAFLRAVADFFPRSKVSVVIKRKLTQMMAKMDETLETEVEQIFDRQMEKMQASTLNASAGASPV
jgi:hypothetical protein